MQKRSLRIVTILLIACSAIFSRDTLPQKNSFAQPDDGIYFMGTIENNGLMTGVFGRRRGGVSNKSWCVFIDPNGQVYKMAFIDRDLSNLYIDGKKVDDSLIWKHTAEFRAYYDKYWRDRDIEAESAALDAEMKPLTRKIESVAKQMEKIARQGDSSSDNKSLDTDRERLAQIERNLDKEIEGFAKRQELLAKEQESLRLMDETDRVMDQILQDLKALGAIKQKANTTFKLSTTEFIINGKAASPEIYELLKNRYLPDSPAETGFVYHWKER